MAPPPSCCCCTPLGDPESMEIDDMAKAAAAGAYPDDKPPPTKKPSTHAPPSGPTLQELLPPGANLGDHLEKLEKLLEGDVELEHERQKVSKLLATAPLSDLKDLDPDSPEYKEREARAKALRDLAAYRLLGAAYDASGDSLITICRRLEKLAGKQWDPTTSPVKMAQAVPARVSLGDKAGIGPIPIQPLFEEITEQAVGVPLSITGTGDNGLKALQQLLDSAKEKRVRKDPQTLRRAVQSQLKKLQDLSGGLLAEGKAEGAAQCMAAYVQLREVYMRQFLPLVQQLGFKDAVDVTLQADSPLSDIDATQWKQLCSQANGGQFMAILEQLRGKIPAAQPRPKAPRKGKKKRPRSRSSGSSDDDSNSSDSEKEEEQRMAKPPPQPQGLSARAIGNVIGKEFSKALSQAFRQHFSGGGGWGGGRGRGGNGRGGHSKGGRGEGRKEDRE